MFIVVKCVCLSLQMDTEFTIVLILQDVQAAVKCPALQIIEKDNCVTSKLLSESVLPLSLTLTFSPVEAFQVCNE